MSALAFSSLLQQRTGVPATLHCTTRDHSRLGIMSLLWGARAVGIGSVLATTGDYVALGAEHRTSFVRDVDVFDLVGLAREAGHFTGVALNPGLESGRLHGEVKRLERKARAGAQFAVTQPIFDAAGAEALFTATRHIGIPIMLGILPLRTARHATFLHDQVAGIVIPETIRHRLEQAADPLVEGVEGAREMLQIARRRFAGACIMPPFGRYEILSDILA
jgi:homocysteine S-methyltransferase